MEVLADDGTLKGVRPLGGSVQFGETRERALHREFAEELHTSIAITGPWHTFENIYRHEGALGHEIVFLAAVLLGNRALYGRGTIAFAEDDGAACRARWIGAEEIACGLPVFPIGLASLLLDAADPVRR